MPRKNSVIKSGAGTQLPLWSPKTDWLPPELSSLPDWSGARRIAIDVETHDENLKELGIGVRRGGYVVGIAFAIEDGPAHYLPTRHQDTENNLDPHKTLRYLKAQAKKFKGDYVGANISYDLDYLLEEGIVFNPSNKFLDIQIADPLINELHDSYSLDNIAKRYELPGKNEDVLRAAARAFNVDPKNGLWKLPARFVGDYATADVVQPLLIMRRQERIIGDNELQNIWNLETNVLPVLVQMRRRGVRVDLKKLTSIEEWCLQAEKDALANVFHHTGITVYIKDVWKAKALAPVLEKIGVTVPRTSQGNYSVDKDVLAQAQHPAAKALAWCRKVNKLRTTFAASVRAHLVKDRIHCTFNQIISHDKDDKERGARYGRLSSSSPNMQQQPNPEKDPDFAGEWRKIYLPEEGMLWACTDYSQQEPRWTTHFAALMDYPKAKIAAQAYVDDPYIDNHQFMADITGLPRAQAKLIFLGLCYGEGGAKLCKQLGLPTRWALSITAPDSVGRRLVMHFNDYSDLQQYKQQMKQSETAGFSWEAAGSEGQKILDKFNNNAPYIRKLAKDVERRVNSRGYIITGGGRRLNFPKRPNGSYEWAHKSLNRLIQGTGADQTKKAITEIHNNGHWIALQVHDDANSSVKDKKEADQIADIMRSTMSAKVPFRVDVETGPSWGDLTK